ncbi:hypothetical protein [Vibrio sp. EA2]|uniref:hypothetical protein n=1 Tax=Vibrio sp. EA2 TaxID=3079860 RepID=UPI002949629B|nr:hypothetical protein [Vibrio sp. EA2]MDV6250234.1 hypothetical protein [Vibrio sp. EA2]
MERLKLFGWDIDKKMSKRAARAIQQQRLPITHASLRLGLEPETILKYFAKYGKEYHHHGYKALKVNHYDVQKISNICLESNEHIDFDNQMKIHKQQFFNEITSVWGELTTIKNDEVKTMKPVYYTKVGNQICYFYENRTFRIEPDDKFSFLPIYDVESLNIDKRDIFRAGIDNRSYSYKEKIFERFLNAHPEIKEKIEGIRELYRIMPGNDYNVINITQVKKIPNDKIEDFLVEIFDDYSEGNLEYYFFEREEFHENFLFVKNENLEDLVFKRNVDVCNHCMGDSDIRDVQTEVIEFIVNNKSSFDESVITRAENYDTHCALLKHKREAILARFGDRKVFGWRFDMTDILSSNKHIDIPAVEINMIDELEYMGMNELDELNEKLNTENYALIGDSIQTTIMIRVEDYQLEESKAWNLSELNPEMDEDELHLEYVTGYWSPWSMVE